jgi:hypothetical protein
MNTAQGIIENLIYISPKRHLMYATDIKYGQPSHIYEVYQISTPWIFFDRDSLIASLVLPPRPLRSRSPHAQFIQGEEAAPYVCCRRSGADVLLGLSRHAQRARARGNAIHLAWHPKMVPDLHRLDKFPFNGRSSWRVQVT